MRSPAATAQVNRMTMQSASETGQVRSRFGVDMLLAQLAADMPGLLEDRNTFFREFEDRACRILAVTAPEDEDYVDEVLGAYVARARVNE
jgi:hypothetical protein